MNTIICPDSFGGSGNQGRRDVYRGFAQFPLNSKNCLPDAVADLEPALMPPPRLAIFVGNEMVIEGILGNISTADGGPMALVGITLSLFPFEE